MMTAMIDGQPNRNDPSTVAVPKAPITRPRVCSAYTTCVVVTSDSFGVLLAAAGVFIGGSGKGRDAQHSAGAGRFPSALQARKPRLRVAKFPMFGSTSGRSESATPIQVAKVAAYCSTAVVGIRRPLPASVLTPAASSG